jgi:hypothetical protein
MFFRKSISPAIGVDGGVLLRISNSLTKLLVQSPYNIWPWEFNALDMFELVRGAVILEIVAVQKKRVPYHQDI